MLVYLADLGHNQVTFGSRIYPISVTPRGMRKLPRTMFARELLRAVTARGPSSLPSEVPATHGT